MANSNLNARIKVDVIASDSAMRESTRMLLEMHDYAGQDYASGMEYLLGGATRPHCVLTDHMLSDMTGVDFVEHLRTCGETTPAVMLLARADQQMASQATRLAFKLVETPATPSHLLGSIFDSCFEPVTRAVAAHMQSAGGALAGSGVSTSGEVLVDTSFSNWSDEASVGIAVFDGEHANLFALAIDIYDAALAGEPELVLCNLLARLQSDASLHFAHEEEYMRFADYPGRHGHAEAHRALKKDLLERLTITDKRRTDPAGFALETVRFLKRWLMGHIRNEDTALGVFLNTRNLR